MKFYTQEGNLDILTLNTEVFSIRDPMRFPAFTHSQKDNPVTGLPDPTEVWDFFSLTTESMAVIVRIFSDRGTPDGFRKMNSFAINAFVLVSFRQSEI